MKARNEKGGDPGDNPMGGGMSIEWLKRIESILRNGLPHSDKDIAGAIAHAHAEIELLLESIDQDWWMK